jgi:hypothetical protein
VSDPTQGYAVVLTALAASREYDASEFTRDNNDILRKLRSSLVEIKPAAYRGISRNPLSAYPELSTSEIDDLERRGVDVRSNERARALLRQVAVLLHEDDPMEPFLITSREDARRVHGLLDDPQDYEIVSLYRDLRLAEEAIFGFDIGYWGGDHFSLICDTAVAPRWHPPDPSDWTELGERLRALNQHMLFSSPADANAFLAYYRTKSWAETESEPGEFCIIGVGAC